jgi:endonuclease/exonuclease/phosphatase family metal-dependent hydrolase
MRRLILALVILVLLARPGMASELRVLTFNSWGIKDARDKKERFALMPEAVAGLKPDIIIFQEVFEEWEREVLKRGLVQAGYPADGFRYFPLRSYGTGIYVASRYPIVGERFEPYQSFLWSENKEQLGRGMAVLRIQTPEIEFLLATTHITPGNLADLERSEGMLEFFEISRLIYEEAGKSGLKNVILAGDLNADPNKLIYHILPALTGLENAYSCTHHGEFAPTNDRRENPNTIIGIEAIDHIFFGNLSADGKGLIPKSAEVVFNKPYPSAFGKNYFLSDHFGVLAVFELSENAPRIKSAMIQQPADLTGEEKSRLLAQLRSDAKFSEPKELWIRLGLAVLADQDQSRHREARLIRAGSKLLIGLSGNSKFKLNSSDIKILRQWLEEKK